MSDALTDGIPEYLYTDIESEIHQHMGHDGQSDETNDWVHDLMSAVAPLIARELRPGSEPKPLAYGRFSHRLGATAHAPEYVLLHVEQGQENLHIDGEYAIYRRTDRPRGGEGGEG